MSTAKFVSLAEPITLYLCSKPNHHSSLRQPGPGKISFGTHISKSRISIENASGLGRNRPGTRFQAFYAPSENAETLYQILGIPETGATHSDIKKAYRQMALKYHPDIAAPDQVRECSQRFIMVHEAYKTLSDPENRALYDRDLALGGLSTKKSRQRMEEKREWRIRWRSQLDELKRRRKAENRMSWGAQMRSQRT